MDIIEPQHKLLVIKTTPRVLSGRKTLYHSVRWAWRINPARAAKADYILGCVGDTCRGVFTVDRWLQATPRNFPHFADPANRPDFPHHRPDRYGFDGQEAGYDVQQIYVGKQLPLMQQGGQNPIRYIGC